MKIIAHRGASAYAPENTIEAFEKAIEMGADMIEFDVRRTQDGEMVIHHDSDIDGRIISEIKLEELRIIKPEVPTFQEVLENFGQRIGMDIELKESGYEKEVMSMINRFMSKDNFIVTSFDAEIIRAIKEEFPHCKAGLLTGIKHPSNMIFGRAKEIFPFRQIRMSKADFLVAQCQFLSTFILWRARFHKIPLIVWGSDDSILAKELKKKNIWGFITNEPDIMLK